MPYKTLETYRNGELSHLWARELFILRDADPKLSSQRAGKLAAAKIAAQAGREYTKLEEALKVNADEGTYSVCDRLLAHLEKALHCFPEEALCFFVQLTGYLPPHQAGRARPPFHDEFMRVPASSW